MVKLDYDLIIIFYLIVIKVIENQFLKIQLIAREQKYFARWVEYWWWKY